MASRYEISLSPMSGWDDITRPDGNLFYSTEWHQLLKSSFNTQTLYIRDSHNKTAYNLSVFTKWPLRIAYLNFPVGLSGEDSTFDSGLLPEIKSRGIAHILKIPVSGICINKPMNANRYRKTPETVIMNLGEWDIKNLKNSVKRNVRKGQNSSLIHFTLDCNDYAKGMHELYKSTITRAGGSSRYTVNYFRELLDLSTKNPLMNITGMKSQNGKLLAYLVTARHENISFYLHGAMNPDYSQERPMYSLFENAINKARHDGDILFNMMSSPTNQSGLIHFKEQWNATTMDHCVCDFFLSSPFGFIYESALMIERFIKRS